MKRLTLILLVSAFFVSPVLSPILSAKSGDGWVSLFDGKTLDGWKQINGTAKYVVENGTIVGTTVKGSANSFLCTEKYYEFLFYSPRVGKMDFCSKI